MRGDIEVPNPATTVFDHEEAVEQSEGDGGHREEVKGKVNSRWFRRNASHCFEGSPRRRIRRRYRATVRSDIVKPSFWISPWLRGAPHVGFSAAICLMRSRTSSVIRGRPPAELERQRH